MTTIIANNRIYSGQDLGIKWGNGDITRISEEEVKRCLRLDENGYYRILDYTPLGRLPVVILDESI